VISLKPFSVIMTKFGKKSGSRNTQGRQWRRQNCPSIPIISKQGQATEQSSWVGCVLLFLISSIPVCPYPEPSRSRTEQTIRIPGGNANNKVIAVEPQHFLSCKCCHKSYLVCCTGFCLGNFLEMFHLVHQYERFPNLASD